jgi:UDP-glucose 4-epimerase
VLDNLSTGHRGNLAQLGNRVTLLEGDLTSREDVERAVQGVEVVFHQGALASVPRSVAAPRETNAACVTGTVNLLDAARRAGVRRVVYAASSSAYGDQPYTSKREVDIAAPLSPYAAAKLAGEYYCQAFTASYGLETVSLRYFNVFGPRQDPESEYAAVIPKFVTRMLTGQRPIVFGDGHQSRDFTYVDNVVAGNLAAANADNISGRVLNLACGRRTDLLELIAAINRVLGTQIDPVFEQPRPGDVYESLADITLARELLRFEPLIDFDEGLRRSIEYYRGLG